MHYLVINPSLNSYFYLSNKFCMKLYRTLRGYINRCMRQRVLFL